MSVFFLWAFISYTKLIMCVRVFFFCTEDLFTRAIHSTSPPFTAFSKMALLFDLSEFKKMSWVEKYEENEYYGNSFSFNKADFMWKSQFLRKVAAQ